MYYHNVATLILVIAGGSDNALERRTSTSDWLIRSKGSGTLVIAGGHDSQSGCHVWVVTSVEADERIGSHDKIPNGRIGRKTGGEINRQSYHTYQHKNIAERLQLLGETTATIPILIPS